MPDDPDDPKKMTEWQKCPREKTTQRWTHAIPLEIIYLTPLLSWNPHNLHIHTTSKGQNEVTANGAKGTKEQPYNGTAIHNHFYITPEEFFTNIDQNSDAADTSKLGQWHLDQDGIARQVSSSGNWILLPPIDGVTTEDTKLRLRFPVYPIAIDGNSIYKELRATTKLLFSGKHTSDATAKDTLCKLRLEDFGLKFRLTEFAGHSHNFLVEGSEVSSWQIGTEKSFTSSLVNAHQHTVVVRRTTQDNFVMVSLGNPVEAHHLAVSNSNGGMGCTAITDTVASADGKAHVTTESDSAPSTTSLLAMIETQQKMLETQQRELSELKSAFNASMSLANDDDDDNEDVPTSRRLRR